MAPIVPYRALAEVAAMRRLYDETDERGSAYRFRESPGRGLVEPHQRSFKNKTCIHAEIHGELHGFHGIVAAIGVARKIRFAHAADNMLEAASVGERRRQAQEHKVAAGDECIGQAARIGGDLDIVGHCRCGDLRQGLDADHVVLAEAVAPRGEILTKRFADRSALVELDAMSLAVIESNRLDPRISIECQGKTCRRILAAGKQDERPPCGSGHRAAPVSPGETGKAAPACRLAMRPRGRAKILADKNLPLALFNAIANSKSTRRRSFRMSYSTAARQLRLAAWARVTIGSHRI